MESSVKCRIEDKTYNTGDRVCDEQKCYVCESGEWRYRYIDFIDKFSVL